MNKNKSYIGKKTDSKNCPNCGRSHTKEHCSYCDDWHYCDYEDCGYWWSCLDGETIDREAFEEVDGCEEI